jgi:tetratricopeptide (TPR) repeat protein
MVSKEVMVSAPLVVLLYDRTFCAGSFREAWRRRHGLYLGLAGTWLLLAGLVISTDNRGGTAGLGTACSSWEYLCTQFGAIVHYLQLCVWPHPLVLDYGVGTARGAAQIVPYVIVVGLIGVATVVSLWRWPKVGFLGAWFFMILAPSSSVVPVVTQTVAEHRMYLPLAAVATGIVVGGWVVGQRLAARGKAWASALPVLGGSLALSAGVALGIITFQRNADYRSDLTIWRDTVAKAPDNDRAHNNLGAALNACGRIEESMAEYDKALKINPEYAEARYNLGVALAKSGRLDEALSQYQKAVEIKPDYADAQNNMGVVLADRGKFDEAIPHYQETLKINPESAEADNNLGNALTRCGRSDEALAYYRRALEIKPDFAEAHYNLGAYLARAGRVDEAMVHYRKALEIKPDLADARYDLGDELCRQGRVPEAVAQWSELIRLQPDNIPALNQLAWVLAASSEASVRDGAKAVELAGRAVQLSGGREPAAMGTLAAAYAEAGRFPEALQTARKAVELATGQGKHPLAESIKAKIPLYEARAAFREMSRPPAAGSTQP